MTFGTSGIVLRFFTPDRLSRGISSTRCAAALGAFGSGIKLAEASVLAIRREVPPGRVLLPGIVFAELVRVSLGQTTRESVIVALMAFEIVLIAFALTQLRRVHRSYHFLEEHFELVFRQFLPDRLAALASREVVLLWEGLRWVGRGFRNKPVEGFSYVQESVARYLPVIIPIVSLGDEIVVGILLRNQAVWIRLAVIGVDVWAILFCFGLYSTFCQRPHQLNNEVVRLRCGVFRTCEFNPGLLLDTKVVPDMELPKHSEGVRLTVKGTPVIKITLREPAIVHLASGRERISNILFVSVDAPDRFCRTLKLAATRSRDASFGSNL